MKKFFTALLFALGLSTLAHAQSTWPTPNGTQPYPIGFVQMCINASGQAVPVDAAGVNCPTGGGASGGPATIANGADVAQGNTADTAYAGTGSATVVAALKGLYNAVNSSSTTALPAGSAIIGNVRIDQTTTGTTNGITPVPSATSAAGLLTSSSAALTATQSVSGVHNLYSYQISADSTLSGAAWWLMIFDATAAPADGAVTPKKCYAMPSGSTLSTGAFTSPLAFATGISFAVSTTGCFTKTASVHAFISLDYK